MIDKYYLKSHLQKREELKAMTIRYNLLLDKDDILSPAGKTSISKGSMSKSSTIETAVCKKVLAEEKIKGLKEDLEKQDKIINLLLEKLENPYEKLVMQMRYEDGLDWNEIREGIFGNKKDYRENVEKYNDKIFKIHGAALKRIKELQIDK